VDYSFNEWPAETEILHGRQGERLSVYDLTDLIAEKYRSVLQQVVRNRARYQDVYDLNYLFSVCGELDAHIQQTILEKLLKSSKNKLPVLTGREMQDPEVMAKTRERYAELASQVMNPPPFEQAYKTVQDFYERLPWL
jgi:predicted nucleotidyltransferase component of viral defense system